MDPTRVLRQLGLMIDATADENLEAVLAGLEPIRDRGWLRFEAHVLQQKPKAAAPATVAAPGPIPTGPDLTVPEVSRLLHMSECWVRRHAAQLGAVRHGGSLRFPAAGLERYRRRQERAA